MKEQKLTMKQILLIVIFSILGGLLFTLLFAWFSGDPFMKVLPIGFWFGPLMGIIMTIMRFTRGKMVEETIDYDGNEDYSRRMKSILERLKYRLKGESENDYEWKYDGDEPDLLLSGNVTVQIKNTTVKITGPKIVVKKLKEFLSK